VNGYKAAGNPSGLAHIMCSSIKDLENDIFMYTVIVYGKNESDEPEYEYCDTSFYSMWGST
jgi:hypothetical protein